MSDKSGSGFSFFKRVVVSYCLAGFSLGFEKLGPSKDMQRLSRVDLRVGTRQCYWYQNCRFSKLIPFFTSSVDIGCISVIVYLIYEIESLFEDKGIFHHEEDAIDYEGTCGRGGYLGIIRSFSPKEEPQVQLEFQVSLMPLSATVAQPRAQHYRFFISPSGSTRSSRMITKGCLCCL